MPAKKKISQKRLTDIITGALQDKKAKDIVVLDFKKLGSSVCDAFIICHGTSRPQVEAIQDGLMRMVKTEAGMNPFHKEGQENAEWILIDYGDILVHIFQESTRIFYNLEQLWADAKVTRVKSDD